MLNLANLRTLLSRVLDFPTLHTVALFTPEGELICYETDAYKTKDHVRVIVGLSTEVWQETKDNGNVGMVDSELGHLLVVPVETLKTDESDPYLLLLALNSDASVPWDELETKAKAMAGHLQRPAAQLPKVLPLRRTLQVPTRRSDANTRS